MQFLRKLATCILAGVLFVQSVASQQPVANDGIQQRIAALPANAHVALQLTDGKTLRGHIGTRNQQDFALKPDNGGAPETIAYAQVSAVEQIKGRSKTKWIIIGVVGGVILVVGLIALHIKNHPLGSGVGF